MRRVLVLGYVGDAVVRLGDEVARSADWRLVSLSPAVSDYLRTANVPHVSVVEYVGVIGWEAIHEEIAGVLRGLSADPPDAAWLDDWSHLIVDEARVPFFWSHLAHRIVDVERPSLMLIQEPLESHSSYLALSSMAAACRLLGQPVATWPFD
jgi:hypothetical protein